MNNSLLSTEHFDYIKVSVESDLATVTLDRVEKRNAFNLEMWKEINGAFTSLDENHDIKCIVIRGGDDKYFGVGADISEFEKDRKKRQSIFISTRGLKNLIYQVVLKELYLILEKKWILLVKLKEKI